MNADSDALASESNGDAILADFVIVSDPKKSPIGYEPSMTFGGIPYNFDRCDTDGGTTDSLGCELYSEDGLYDRYREKNPPVYIYYRPSVAYPSVNADGSPATRYISGITTVIGNSGDNSGYNFSDSFAYHHGYVTENVILVLRTYYGISSYFRQFLGYSPTHDLFSLHKLKIKYYEDDNKDDMLPEDFETAGFWQGPYSKTDYNVSWETSSLRAKAIYACGPTTNAEPLREDDILVSNASQKQHADGKPDTSWTSVQDFRTPNATTAHNLAYRSKSAKTQRGVYIYMHREQPQERQYIKSVTLAVSDVKENVWQRVQRDSKDGTIFIQLRSPWVMDTCLTVGDIGTKQLSGKHVVLDLNGYPTTCAAARCTTA